MKIREALRRSYVARYIEAERARRKLRRVARKLTDEERRVCEIEALEAIMDMNRKREWP